MTQTPPVKWIVPLPENDPYGKKSFTNACRGNSDLGEVLNYFLYAASKEVEQDKSLDTSTGSITVDRMLDTISKYLKVSKKTAIARIQKLAGWEFITPHGYHHRYDVHFKKIEAAIINPPEVEKPKLRGRHAVKTTIFTIPTICDDKKHEDCKDLPDLPDGRIVVLETQIVNLQSEIVDLTAWIVDLQSRIVDLQSLQSSEGTPQETREAQIDPLVITNNYSNITEDNIYVNASALTRTHSSENETHYPQSNTSSPQDIHTEQQASELPIATTTSQTDALVGVATRNTESLVEPSQAEPPPKPPKPKVPPGPLEMPPDDARWCAEIAVQIVEFKKGRRYGEVTRKQELEKARQALKYEVDGALLTRTQFIYAWDRMNEWPLWVEKNIAPMIKHLLKDDRIISLIQQPTRAPSGSLNNGHKRAVSPTANTTYTPPTSLDVERNERNTQKLFAKSAEIRAAREAAAQSGK